MAMPTSRAGALRLRFLSLVLVIVATGACATPRVTANGLRGRGAFVEVRNEEFDDMVIYLVRGGTPVPLGIVPGLSSRALRVGEGQLADGGAVALAAGRRGASITLRTTPFDLLPGRVATWRVRPGAAVEQPIVRPQP